MKNALWAVAFGVLIAIFVVVGVMRRGGAGAGRQIGVIPKETASVYWEGVRQGALKAGAEEKYEILWNGPEIETDRERQIQIIEDMIARKVDGIVLAPNDRKALVPAVERIDASKIPCVIIDSGVETDKYLAFLATDNYKGGVLAAQRMGESWGARAGSSLWNGRRARLPPSTGCRASAQRWPRNSPGSRLSTRSTAIRRRWRRSGTSRRTCWPATLGSTPSSPATPPLRAGP
jgi:ABC-type sugar transport system substrate-binding protein